MRTILGLLSVVVLGVSAGTPVPVVASEPDCAQAKEQLSALTKRVEALERQLRAAQAAAPRPSRPSAPAAKQGPDPLYGKIDGFLAAGDIEAAKKALADRKATDPPSGMLNTLTREMDVVGKSTPDPWGIEKWYQGEAEIDLDKGTTLLVFWEAWCPHCKNEVPRLQQTYERFKDKGLQVVGLTRITKTATEEMVTGLIETGKVTYPMAKETGEVATYFNVKGIPAAAVVKDGKIIWRGHPLRLTDEMLEGWL